MTLLSRLLLSLRRSQYGALAVEAALVTPALLLLTVGSYTWGGYLYLTHEVQAAAEQAASNASLARDPIDQERRARLAVNRLLPGASAELAVERDANRLNVTVSYDASDSLFQALRGPLASPPARIVRAASVDLPR